MLLNAYRGVSGGSDGAETDDAARKALVCLELVVPATEGVCSGVELCPLIRRMREVTDNGGDLEERSI
jgi:hypothetical protein